MYRSGSRGFAILPALVLVAILGVFALTIEGIRGGGSAQTALGVLAVAPRTVAPGSTAPTCDSGKKTTKVGSDTNSQEVVQEQCLPGCTYIVTPGASKAPAPQVTTSGSANPDQPAPQSCIVKYCKDTKNTANCPQKVVLIGLTNDSSAKATDELNKSLTEYQKQALAQGTVNNVLSASNDGTNISPEDKIKNAVGKYYALGGDQSTLDSAFADAKAGPSAPVVICNPEGGCDTMPASPDELGKDQLAKLEIAQSASDECKSDSPPTWCTDAKALTPGDGTVTTGSTGKTDEQLKQEQLNELGPSPSNKCEFEQCKPSYDDPSGNRGYDDNKTTCYPGGPNDTAQCKQEGYTTCVAATDTEDGYCVKAGSPAGCPDGQLRNTSGACIAACFDGQSPGKDGCYSAPEGSPCPSGFEGQYPKCTKSATPTPKKECSNGGDPNNGCKIQSACTNGGTPPECKINSTFPPQQQPQQQPPQQQHPGGGGGGGGSNPMSQLGQALQKALGINQPPPPPPQQQQPPPQQCPTDPQQYAQYQQQYQQQLQQYNYQQQQYQYQMQQYQYQQQMNQYYQQQGYPPQQPSPQPQQPQQPQACTPATGNQCQLQLQQTPPAANCSVGTWKPIMNGVCVTSWQCVPSTSPTSTPPTTPTAQLSCQPKVADVGMSLAISYSCSSGVAKGTGFTVTDQPAGSATTTVTNPPAGANTATYSLTCTDQGLTAGAQCSVQISKPTIVLVANPKTVKSGAISLLGWVTTGMQSCTISSPDEADFTSRNSYNTSVGGTATSSPITGNTTFLLHCETAGGIGKDATTTVSVTQ